MTELETRIMAALAAADPEVLMADWIAAEVGAEEDAVVACLHRLQDSEHVFLRNGHYRLSAWAKGATA